MLTFLSKHGYEVVIPEMVAYESGWFMRNYKSVWDYIGRTSQWVPEVSEFIRAIPSLIKTGHNIHIEPPHPEDASEGAKLMRKLDEIATDDTLSDRTKYYKSEEAYYRFKEKKHRGDVAAEHLIASFKKPCPPVYYLTDDEGAWNNIAPLSARLPVSRLNTLGLYEAFETNLLLPEVDIAAKRTVFLKHGVKTARYPQGLKAGAAYAGMDFSPRDNLNIRPLEGALTGFSVIVKQDNACAKHHKEALLKKYKEREMLSEEALRPEHPEDAYEDYVASHKLYLSHKPANNVSDLEAIGKIDASSQRYHD